MIKKVAIKLLSSKMGWLLKLVTGLIAGFGLDEATISDGIPADEAEAMVFTPRIWHDRRDL